MKFKCNNMEYEIQEVEYIDLQEGLIGQAQYQNKKILLKKLDKDLMIRTLKHELAHIWLFEHAHNQENKEFYIEDVCEIVACSNDFINDIIDKYLKQKEHIE